MDLKSGVALVDYARQAIDTFLRKGGRLEWSTQDPSLLEKRGVFVTLLEGARMLRGCIGAPYPDGPLISQLVEVAIDAATSDPRFPPVTLPEFTSRIIVEVTVLSNPEELRVEKPIRYADQIMIGRDGLMIEGLEGRGLLLPQVAVEEGFDAEEFLSQACLKAGLLPDAWLAGEVRVSRFQGQIFTEASPQGPVLEKTITNID